MRVGSGFDAHAFDDQRPLMIGGIHIPDHAGLAGHSDADVLCHAIADALLGAARLGDLGARFPDDERWRGSSGLEIVGEAARLVRSEGWSCVNVDATVIAERPRLSPFVSQMADGIAVALDIEAAAVSVKATTTDGMGFTGRGEGIAAMATVLVDRAPTGPK
jgi:2-C-methyl-D-erythritol 2,4-cyclodiphosphate synthase